MEKQKPSKKEILQDVHKSSLTLFICSVLPFFVFLYKSYAKEENSNVSALLRDYFFFAMLFCFGVVVATKYLINKN